VGKVISSKLPVPPKNPRATDTAGNSSHSSDPASGQPPV